MLIQNKNNPLGLWRERDTTYQLVAYFYFNNFSEIEAESITSFNYSSYLFKYNTINSDRGLIQNITYKDVMDNQLSHYLPRTSRLYHAFYGGGKDNVVFLFKKYEGLVSFKELKNISSDLQQSVIDYFSDEKKLPLLITENRFMGLYKEELNIKEKGRLDRYKQGINYEDVLDIFLDDKYFKHKKIENQKEKVEKVRKVKIKFYDEFVQKERQITTLLKGGFVKVNILGHEYSLPKLPMIALAQGKNDYIDYESYTWFFDNKYKDISCPILSDIFMISNIDPIEINNNLLIKELKAKAIDIR